MADETIYEEILRDSEPVTVTLPISHWWLLVGGLQIASRHKGMSVYVKDAWRGIVATIEPEIVAKHPAAEGLIKQGWDDE